MELAQSPPKEQEQPATQPVANAAKAYVVTFSESQLGLALQPISDEHFQIHQSSGGCLGYTIQVGELVGGGVALKCGLIAPGKPTKSILCKSFHVSSLFCFA